MTTPTYNEAFFTKAILKYVHNNNIRNNIDVTQGIKFTYIADTETIIINKWENFTVQPPTNDILKAYTQEDIDTVDALEINNKNRLSLVNMKARLGNDFTTLALYKITERIYKLENGLAVDATIDQTTLETYILTVFGLN